MLLKVLYVRFQKTILIPPAEFSEMNDDLSKVDWSSTMTGCEEDYAGEKDGSHFVQLIRKTVLETCILSTEPKKTGLVGDYFQKHV